MLIKVRISGSIPVYVQELKREVYGEYKRDKFVEIPDEEFLNLEGYAATNHIYDKTRNVVRILSPLFCEDVEIFEDGIAYDIPYLNKSFESVKEMREFLSSNDVIKEFDTNFEEERREMRWKINDN